MSMLIKDANCLNKKTCNATQHACPFLEYIVFVKHKYQTYQGDIDGCHRYFINDM